MTWTKKRIHQRTVWVSPDGKYRAYPLGRFWFMKPIDSGQVLFKGKSLRDIEKYVENKNSAGIGLAD
jgi:hypothetical protein